MENFSKYEDNELLKLIQTGKKSVADNAFRALFARYSARLNAFIAYKLGKQSISEDIFQQTWIKFYGSVRCGNELSAVLPFLVSIARNLAIDYYRSQKSRRSHIEDVIDPNIIEEIAIPSTLQSVEQSELGELISAAINCLDGIYKEAFIMKRVDGLTLEEIAEIQNISLSAAKQRVSRATNMVRVSLAPHIKDYIKI